MKPFRIFHIVDLSIKGKCYPSVSDSYNHNMQKGSQTFKQHYVPANNVCLKKRILSRPGLVLNLQSWDIFCYPNGLVFLFSCLYWFSREALEPHTRRPSNPKLNNHISDISKALFKSSWCCWDAQEILHSFQFSFRCKYFICKTQIKTELEDVDHKSEWGLSVKSQVDKKDYKKKKKTHE